jgi:hypothetical protein
MPIPAFVTKVRKAQDGSDVMGVEINPVKPYTRSYWLTPDAIPTTLAALGAAGDFLDLRFEIDTQGHFTWAAIEGVSTGAFSLKFFDAQKQRLLQNRPVHSTTVMGLGNRYFRLPKPYFFDIGDSRREISCIIQNLTGVNNTIHLVLYGRRFYHKEMPPPMAEEIARNFEPDWREFSYFLAPKETNPNGTVTPVAALGTASFTFETDDNADIECQKIMVASTGSFTFDLRERDKGGGRILATGVIDSTMGLGNAEFPFLLGDTFLLERKKHLFLEVTDTSAAPNSIFATIAGKQMQYR